MVVSQACYQRKTAALARQVNKVYINNLLAATSFTQQSSSLDIHSESSPSSAGRYLGSKEWMGRTSSIKKENKEDAYHSI